MTVEAIRDWKTETRTRYLLRRLRVIQRLYVIQGGRCAVCREALKFTGREPHLDHNHDCVRHGDNKIPQAIAENCACLRGLLCRLCNTVLVAAVENPHHEAAVRYVEKWAA